MNTVQRTNGGAVIGALDLRQDIRRVYWRGTQVGLTLTEFNIVACLATRPDADVTYWRIHEIACGNNFAVGYGGVDARCSVVSHIKRIRAKFRTVDREFDQIGNYPAFGYFWRANAGEPGS